MNGGEWCAGSTTTWQQHTHRKLITHPHHTHSTPTHTHPRTRTAHLQHTHNTMCVQPVAPCPFGEQATPKSICLILQKSR